MVGNVNLESFGDRYLAVTGDSQDIENFILGSIYQMGPRGGLGLSITVLLTIATTAHRVKCALYNYTGQSDNKTLVMNGVTEEKTVAVGTTTVNTFKFVGTKPVLLPKNWYHICVWAEATTGTCRMICKLSGGLGVNFDSEAYGTYPNPWAQTAWDADASMAIYCTYVTRDILHADNGIGLQRHPRSRIY